MKRVVTQHCRWNGCPHLVWEYYLTSHYPQKKRRRGICMFFGKQPGNMYFCPLEAGMKITQEEESNGGIYRDNKAGPSV